VRVQALGRALLLLAFAAPALAEDAKPAPFTFSLHGFISASLYAQDANIGPSDGQLASYGAAPTVALKLPSKDKLILNGDVRQSRFNFSVGGPKIFSGTTTPRAVLEIDFMGGFGSGANGDTSLTPRLRYAYAEIDTGSGTRIVAGQANDLIFAMAPTSLSHIGQPYGYGAGNVGWRRPAAFGFHTFGGDAGGLKTEVAWEVGRSNWADAGGIGAQGVTPSTATGGTGDRFGNNMGAASGLPALETRLTVSSGATFTAFATGHWMKIDRSGADVVAPTTGSARDLDVVVGNVGVKAVMGPLTLAATGFTGKNLAPLIGSFQQFQPLAFGDVHEYGGWIQGGLNFTKELSAWAFVGTDKPNTGEATKANFARLQNVSSVGMLQYRDGGWATGLEFLHFHTKTHDPAAGAGKKSAVDGAYDANQAIASVNYFF
jgi:hypothetical protein